ncbi:MAG: hypothetical protein GY861_27270 [bacterium]|nr:hypothetical protein [bacterium]
MVSPETDLSAVRAREMLKIILELGAYLQEQVDKRSIRLDDHAILKEAEAWMERRSIVAHGYKPLFGRTGFYEMTQSGNRPNDDQNRENERSRSRTPSRYRGRSFSRSRSPKDRFRNNSRERFNSRSRDNSQEPYNSSREQS